MATLHIDLEKFNGKNDFNIWMFKMKAVLVTQGLVDALLLVTKKERNDVCSSKTTEQVTRFKSVL